MSAKRAYQMMFVGTPEDLERLDAPLKAAGAFDIALKQPDSEGLLRHDEITDKAPDLAVIGSTVERPLPLARQVRTLCPASQIVFLLPPERLERFRASLPFVPNLASSWTADVAADSSSLANLLGEAARASRERAATATVLGLINQRLASNKTAPAQIRRSQLVLSERYLATILSQSPDAFVAADKNGTVIAHNDAALNLFATALDPGEAVSAIDLFPHEERERLQELIARALAGEILSGIEVRLDLPEQSRSHAELSLAPVIMESGGIASISITARDITERKRAEDRQRLLINELNHRVKNTLAIVQALALQSFKGAAPPSEERAAFDARLMALAAAHNLLTRQTWQAVSLAQVIEATVCGAVGANGDRIRVHGPTVTLRPQTAVSMTMVLHELCTNAIKYGALSNNSGRVSTSWELYESDGMPRLRFEWIEQGGPPVEAPGHRGFGSRMIERGLAAELQAEVLLDFRREGVVCVVDAPLPETEG